MNVFSGTLDDDCTASRNTNSFGTNNLTLKDVEMGSVGARRAVSFRKLAEDPWRADERKTSRCKDTCAACRFTSYRRDLAGRDDALFRELFGLTQVPPVFAWPSKADETDVGAECLIMDEMLLEDGKLDEEVVSLVRAHCRQATGRNRMVLQ